MAHVYSEFDSTPATIIADIKTKILLSSDWSNPTGQTVSCTAANGAQMALDLIGGGAADNTRIRPKAWRVFAAGTGTDGWQRSLYWTNASNATTTPLHCKVAAGNTLLYIEIEGPRGGELNNDNVTWGSIKQSVWLAQMTAYLTADVTPAIVFGGSSSYNGSEGANGTNPASYVCHVSRNQAANLAWVPARLWTLNPVFMATSVTYHAYQPVASDGNVMLFPFVVMEDVAGYRGRLTDVFYAGSNNSFGDTLSNLTIGQDVTYGGNTYRVTAPYKSNGNNNQNSYGPFGIVTNQNASNSVISPLIAVRKV